MSRTPFPLLGAFCASLLLHLLPFVDALLPAQERSSPVPPPLLAKLIPPPPELLLTETSAPIPASKVEPPPAPATKTKPARTWSEAIRDQFAEQQGAGLFYPAEAIRLGLQGEALVLLILDTSGEVIAARLEESSGHPLLDDAALQAVRRLRSLPSDAPQETLLPVRFRIKQ